MLTQGTKSNTNSAAQSKVHVHEMGLLGPGLHMSLTVLVHT